MRLFKPTYKNKKGKTKQVNKWWMELKDQNNIVRRFAGERDEGATKAIGRNIEKLISLWHAGKQPDTQLVLWLNQSPEKLKEQLVRIGLLDSGWLTASKSILEHLKDFEKSLALRGKEKHTQQTISMLRKIIDGCGFKHWTDVKASDIEVYLADRRRNGLSKTATSYYALAFRRFSLWMVKEKRASEAPVIHYDKPPKNYGRAFELDEFQRLLEATLSGPVREGLSGQLRYTCYILAAETGLRRAELQSLTPASFDFKSNTVFVSGENTKNGEDAIQEFSTKIAGLLKELVANKMPNVQLFPLTNYTARMIQADCKKAGVKIGNQKRQRLCFHSLRHSCGSFLAAKGQHPKIIQDMMRHKDINLTMNRYVKILKGQRRAAIESLPDFTKKRATGTE